jgi:hypothetical protein
VTRMRTAQLKHDEYKRSGGLVRGETERLLPEHRLR